MRVPVDRCVCAHVCLFVLGSCWNVCYVRRCCACEDGNKTHSFEAEQPKMVRMVKVHGVGVLEHEGSAECVLVRYPLCEV